MKYVSVCSGIEAATVAWHPLGWRPILFAEIDRFPSQVLAHHYPEVPNVGDFTQITKEQCGPVDLLVGGTPCQDFSIAGLREGLGGERGNLTLEFLRLVDRLRPRWVVWENVPGVYSATSYSVTHRDSLRADTDGERIWQDVYANEAHAFSCFLAGFQELGYGFAYRTLDAQYFGVPQRRRRVFLVGHSGDWRRAATVLLERHSLSWNPPPRRETGKVAPTLSSRRTGGGGLGGDFDYDGGLVPEYAPEVAGACTARDYKGARFDVAEPAVIAIQERAICENPNAGPDGVGVRDDGAAFTLEARSTSQAVAFQSSQSGVREVEAHATLDSNNGSRRHNGVVQGIAVRRLTPRECERLQGFPDDYTRITPKTADGPRYKALGNSMAVPVMRWIGERIAMVDAL
jgi:DNA (cytosine-5)-methyltransferase 1